MKGALKIKAPFALEHNNEKLRFIKLNKVDKEFINLVLPDIDKILNVMDLYYGKYLDFQSKAKEVTKKIV